MRSSALVLLLIFAPVAGAQAPVETPSVAEAMARVVTPLALPDDCLAPVEITRIDGALAAALKREFVIEPGRHAFNGRAVLDRRRCWPLADDQVIPRALDLEFELEAGKAYFIAYDRSHPDPMHWRLVMWKVEDIETAGAPEDTGGEPDEPDTVQ